MHAHVAKGVAAGRVQRLHERLQANLAHEVFVDLAYIIVQMRLMVRVMLAALATNAQFCHRNVVGFAAFGLSFMVI